MNKFLKNKKIIFLLISLGVFIIVSETLALEINWPPSPAGTDLASNSTLPDMVKYFYEWGIALGGLAVFIALLIAGIQYLTSIGNPAVMRDAMDRIKSAILGLVLLLSSWLILTTINPKLTGYQPPPADMRSAEEQIRCERDADCEQGFYCNEGVCVPTLEIPPLTGCDYAIVTRMTREGEESKRIKPDEMVKFEGAKTVTSYYYKEKGEGGTCARNCSWCNESACKNRFPHCDWNNGKCYTNCGPTACQCRLELFKKTREEEWKCMPLTVYPYIYCWTEGVDKCKPRIGVVSPAYNDELDIAAGEESIFCVRLKKPEISQ